MSKGEAEDLLAGSEGRLCVRFYRGPTEGKIFISNTPTRALPRSNRLVPIGQDKFSTWNFTLTRATTLAFHAI